ncbi:sphingoid long chain base kinase-like protein [Karstenula rhodostoma CBS 690.94]|uniref:Sphingoid long chain base kinase-like protein n=1 Tax=Karstenula rhodostoma CBS 690.94 TaxID=1392251 RepID=A0A9P4PLS6_9PLEO|nr:sphingoid long chain base kinase-like protein [Karstenula rhodostoma CBS 690.94]
MADGVGEDAIDPFRDPSMAGNAINAARADVPATLAVGRDASLTLGTDALIVLDELLESKGAGCCGISLGGGNNKTTRSIPFYNVLWAKTAEDGEVIIHHAHVVSKQVVRPQIISYKLEKSDNDLAAAWVERLLEKAYGASQRQKRIKVLINPFGGQGKASQMYHKQIAPIFAAARCELDVESTTHNGHGIEIAQNLDIEKFDVVACCSGDGIPHEVWNGFGKREDARRALVKVAVAQLPCGSGNALCLNSNGTDSPSLAALAVVKGLRTPLGLASVTQGDRRMLSFLSQSAGIVAETDLATEHLRWMGSARFTYGFLVRLLKKAVYPADIAIKVEYDNKEAVRAAYRAEAANPTRTHDERTLPAPGQACAIPPLKYGTINDPLPDGWELVPHDQLGNFYAGNLAYMSPDANFFPAALPDDGCLDLIRIKGTLPRTKSIATLLAIEQHTFFDLPHVDYQKISAYRIIPKNQKEGYISVDGERIPFQPFQVEMHKELGTVLSKNGHLFEARGV